MTDTELIAILTVAVRDLAPRCKSCGRIAPWTVPSGMFGWVKLCANHNVPTSGYENDVLTAAVAALQERAES